MKTISDLNIHLYTDGANIADMLEMYKRDYIKGFTTNPTLMRKAGISNYKEFALSVLAAIPDRPISFEVFADEFREMRLQALEIGSWGKNVNVKIPVMNTKKATSYSLIRELVSENLNLNVTAIMTLDQVEAVARAMENAHDGIISIFAGRIADTGLDPIPLMKEAVAIASTINPHLKILWASPRELLNVFHAEEAGCHIITATTDILKKLENVGKNLEEFSWETVKMFYNDANAAKYSIEL
ncbi:MAG: transaldolase [Oligoflexia bacterium]|nr:transaldolase [Oligoflexia bacterium]MBF0364943.1 transaldolase [Oligoflexia bacterium]